MFYELVEKFRDYMGNGLIVLWFLAAVIYLFICEKKKENRILFVYVPVIVLLLVLNPFFAKIVMRYLDNAVYFRFFWLLPVTVVTAYAAVDLYGRLSGGFRKIFAAAAAVLIIVSGKFIYTNENFSVAENIYHVPQSVVDICDAIEYEGREVLALFPAELIPFVRQYNPTICMPYGREVLMDIRFRGRLYRMMEEDEEISAAEFAGEARSQSCVYLIVPEGKKITGSMEACDYEKFAEIDGYIVYKDRTVDLSY